MSSLAERRAARGATLMETLVATALLVVLSGAILGTMIHVRRSIQRNDRRLAMQTYAQSILREIGAGVSAAVPPESLDVPETVMTDDRGSTLPLCEPGILRLVTSRHFDGRDFRVTTYAAVRHDDGRASWVAQEVRPLSLNLRSNVEPVVQGARLGVGDPETLSAVVDFVYAANVDPATMRPDFTPRLAPGTFPVLVHVTVSVQALHKGDDEAPPPYVLEETFRLL